MGIDCRADPRGLQERAPTGVKTLKSWQLSRERGPVILTGPFPSLRDFRMSERTPIMHTRTLGPFDKDSRCPPSNMVSRFSTLPRSMGPTSMRNWSLRLLRPHHPPCPRCVSGDGLAKRVFPVDPRPRSRGVADARRTQLINGISSRAEICEPHSEVQRTESGSESGTS